VSVCVCVFNLNLSALQWIENDGSVDFEQSLMSIFFAHSKTNFASLLSKTAIDNTDGLTTKQTHFGPRLQNFDKLGCLSSESSKSSLIFRNAGTSLTRKFARSFKKTVVQTERQTDGQIGRLTDRRTHQQENGQTDVRTDIQTDKQINR